jgi:S-(hydroxymethyl)glutathione dehydrogenase/alcohol dehydrogenase
VCVIGAGGIGLSAIQAARIAGAGMVVVVDVSDAKLETARQMGGTDLVNARQVDDVVAAVKELTDGGVDYSFEAIGNPATMRAAYDAVRRGGTAVIIGVGKADAMVSFSAFELFYSEKRLIGSYYGSADVRSDFHRLLRLWRAGKLDLEGMISRKLDIGEINDAFAAMRRGEMIRQVVQFEQVTAKVS